MQTSGGGRRKIRRYTSRIRANYESGSISGQGKVTNISRSGLFLLASTLPNTQDSIRVTLLPVGASEVQVEGTVCWTTDQLPANKQTVQGFGVQLAEPTPAFLEVLERLMLG